MLSVSAYQYRTKPFAQLQWAVAKKVQKVYRIRMVKPLKRSITVHVSEEEYARILKRFDGQLSAGLRKALGLDKRKPGRPRKNALAA